MSGESDRELRVALAGAGMISAYHLRAWSKVPGVKVVGLVDPDLDRARRRADEFGVHACFPSLNALLDTESIDAVDIASPRETHGPLLRLAASRKLDAICQKPFVSSIDEAAELTLWLQGRSRVMVNQNFRFRPYFQRAHEWLSEGRLGALTGLTISTRSSGLVRSADGTYPYIERQPFVRTEKRLMIEEVLIHRIDIARWLVGPLSVIGAVARHGCPELAGESEAAILFSTRQHGIPVVVEGNLTAHGLPQTPARDRMELVGERGRILFDGDVLSLHADESEEHVYAHADAYQQAFDAAAAHFVACLRSGTPFLTPPEDNLFTLQLVEDAYRAAGLA